MVTLMGCKSCKGAGFRFLFHPKLTHVRNSTGHVSSARWERGDVNQSNLQHLIQIRIIFVVIRNKYYMILTKSMIKREGSQISHRHSYRPKDREGFQAALQEKAQPQLRHACPTLSGSCPGSSCFHHPICSW